MRQTYQEWIAAGRPGDYPAWDCDACHVPQGNIRGTEVDEEAAEQMGLPARYHNLCGKCLAKGHRHMGMEDDD